MSPYLEAAFEDVETDERGLMPLAEARALLAQPVVFDRERGDELWAALLSLQDAAELGSVAVTWRHHPRGRDNLALVERYGDALVPWIAGFVDAGVLVNLPWCLGPSLLAIGTIEAFRLAFGLRGYNDTADMREWTAIDPEDLDSDGLAEGARLLLSRWCERHPEVALPELARLAEGGDDRAIDLIRDRAERGPRQLLDQLSELCGAGRAEALADRLELPRSITAAAILDHLDRAAGHIWPLFNYAADGRLEYFAMRLTACRAREGDGWGVLFERITGSYPDGLRVERLAYGSELSLDDPVLEAEYVDLEMIGDDPLFHGGRIVGPGGELALDESLIDRHDLRPGKVCEPGYWPYRALLIRAYLAAYPDCLWMDPDVAPGLLGLDGAEVIAVSDRFHHVTGPYRREGVPEQPWEIDPGESPAYRSLAIALVERRSDGFEPGDSNLDWRLHAFVEEAVELPWTARRFDPGDGERGHLEASLREAAVSERDERGLMPLDAARAIVAATDVFDKGAGEPSGDVYVQGSDRLWAALLSLGDAGELAAACAALDWRLDPRGSPDNLAPAQRYGDALVSWFAGRVDSAGVLDARPSCLRANLIATGNPAVADLLLDLTGFAQPGDGASPASQLEALWAAWIDAHPEVAYHRLAELVPDSAAARARLRRCALLDDRGVRAALGDRCEVVCQQIGAPTAPSPEHVLARLDRAASTSATDFDAWPRFYCWSYPGAAEYHGLRLVGLRAGERWAVVLERLTGYGPELRICRYVFTDDGAVDGRSDERDAPIEVELDDGAEPPEGAERMTEQPDYWGAREAPAYNRAFRAALRDRPGAIWGDPADLAGIAGLSGAVDVVVASDRFEHAVGPELPPDTEARPWHRSPGESPAFRSLAARLFGAGDRFDPGEPNTGWELHAVFSAGE